MLSTHVHKYGSIGWERDARMKILHLLAAMNPGGIECWLSSLLPLIDTTNYRMDFFCLLPNRGLVAREVEAHGSRVFGNSTTSSFLEYLIRLRSVLRRERYDVVHSHLGIAGGMPVMVARRAGAATLTTFHTSTFRYSEDPRRFVRFLARPFARFSVGLGLRYSQLTTCVGNQVLGALDRRFSITSVPCRTLRLGVNIPNQPGDLERRRFRKELGLRETTPLVVHVGRYSDQKNHAGLIRTAGRVVARRPDVRFLLVGDGPLRVRTEQLIRELKLADHVRTLGIRRDVERILTCSDVFFFPSRFEGFPVAAMEASATGLPIVGTNVEGLSEAVVDGETGLLCPFGDEAGLSKALLRLLSKPDLLIELGENGRRMMLSGYTRQQSAEELCRLYDRLISTK